MKIIAFIEQAEIIEKILKHLGLWHVKTRPQSKIHSPPEVFFTDYPDSQIPPWDDYQSSVSHPISCVSPLPTFY
jgi:hypothetical protein